MPAHGFSGHRKRAMQRHNGRRNGSGVGTKCSGSAHPRRSLIAQLTTKAASAAARSRASAQKASASVPGLFLDCAWELNQGGMFRCLSVHDPDHRILTSASAPCNNSWADLPWPRRGRPRRAMGAVDKHAQTAADEIDISLNNTTVDISADVTKRRGTVTEAPVRATQTPRCNPRCLNASVRCPLCPQAASWMARPHRRAHGASGQPRGWVLGLRLALCRYARAGWKMKLCAPLCTIVLSEAVSAVSSSGGVDKSIMRTFVSPQMRVRTRTPARSAFGASRRTRPCRKTQAR